MRDAVRNKERWIGRHTPTQDPSTDLTWPGGIIATFCCSLSQIDSDSDSEGEGEEADGVRLRWHESYDAAREAGMAHALPSLWPVQPLQKPSPHSVPGLPHVMLCFSS